MLCRCNASADAKVRNFLIMNVKGKVFLMVWTGYL